jgi:pimeloyl-ACP methyl ester carboxylesterase
VSGDTVAVSAFELIHGRGGSAWDWHLVVPELRQLGHEPIAVDLPTEDESAGWWDYADAVVEAVGDRPHVIAVGHSPGCFTAPLVCARHRVDLLVLVAGVIDCRALMSVEAHGEQFVLSA